MLFFLALAIASIAYPDPFLEQPAILGALAATIPLFLRIAWTHTLLFAAFVCWVIASSFIAIYASGHLVLNSIVSLNLAWMLVSVAVLSRRQPRLETSLAFLCMVNGALGIYRYFTVGAPIGFSNIISLNAAFTAALLPFTWSRPVWFLIAAASIVLQPGLIALALLGVNTLGLVGLRSSFLVFGLASLSGAFCLFGDDGGRFSFGKAVVARLFSTDYYRWFGFGVGSGLYYGPKTQLESGFRTDEIWPAFHSDIVQLAFESGVIGLILGGLLYVQATRAAFQKGREWGWSFLGMGFCAGLYYPAKVPLFAFVFAAMVFKVLEKSACQQQSELG